MKKYFLGIILVLFFVACSSDDDASNTISSNNLVGKWFLKGGTINGGAFVNYDHECLTSKDYQEFFASGIVNYVGYGSDCEVNDTDSSEWELTGNILTVSSPEMDPAIYSYEYIVESITSAELRLKEIVDTPEGTEIRIIYFTKV
jgi:hypothetical protein